MRVAFTVATGIHSLDDEIHHPGYLIAPHTESRRQIHAYSGWHNGLALILTLAPALVLSSILPFRKCDKSFLNIDDRL